MIHQDSDSTSAQIVQVSSLHYKQTNASAGTQSNFLHSVFIIIFIIYLPSHFFTQGKHSVVLV